MERKGEREKKVEEERRREAGGKEWGKERKRRKMVRGPVLKEIKETWHHLNVMDDSWLDFF